MPFSGNSFVRNQNFVADRNSGSPNNVISADKIDNEFDNVASGLTTARGLIENQRALFPAPALALSGQYLCVNAGGTAFEVRTPIQVRADLVIDQVPSIFATPGTYQFPVPKGITFFRSEVWGAGGGSTAFNLGTANAVAQSGGGGSFGIMWHGTKPGDTITVVVGAAGTSGPSPTAGGLSRVNGAYAYGGGVSSAAGSVAVGGATGMATADIAFRGVEGETAGVGMTAFGGEAPGPYSSRGGYIYAGAPGAGGGVRLISQSAASYGPAANGMVAIWYGA